jgi:hypothetical protein
MNAELQNALKEIALTGLKAGLSAIPGAGPAVVLGPLALKGAFALYDHLMAAKPADMTDDEFRRKLIAESEMMNKTGDDFLNEAREDAAARGA